MGLPKRVPPPRAPPPANPIRGAAPSSSRVFFVLGKGARARTRDPPSPLPTLAYSACQKKRSVFSEKCVLWVVRERLVSQWSVNCPKPFLMSQWSVNCPKPFLMDGFPGGAELP